MTLTNITVNTQSSIRIEGLKVLYFDPYLIQDAAHDADFIFITHEHYDHFEPESIAKIKRRPRVWLRQSPWKRRRLARRVSLQRTACFMSRERPMRRTAS